MKDENSTDKKVVLARMMDLCSRSEKCSNDILLKLDQYPLKEGEKDWILESLKKEKFIDDRRFAGYFVKDKFRLNQWGRLKIRQALYMKHLGQEIINDSLGEIEESEYRELLIKLLRLKEREIKEHNLYQKKGKLFRYAAQRGFEADLIYETIDNLLKG